MVHVLWDGSRDPIGSNKIVYWYLQVGAEFSPETTVLNYQTVKNAVILILKIYVVYLLLRI